MSVEPDDLDDKQDNIRSIGECFAAAGQLIVIDGMKLEAPVILERRVVVPNAIDERHRFAERSGTIPIPSPDLVFLRIHVLLASLPDGAAFAHFKSGPVNAVTCS